MKAYSQDLRDRVISKYKSGKYQIKELAIMFNITRQTIGNWLKRYNCQYALKIDPPCALKSDPPAVWI